MAKRLKENEEIKGFRKFLAKLNILFLETLYRIHLHIRYGHDSIYARGGWYKSYSDKAISQTVHKVSLATFVVSFIIFSGIQNLWPYLFTFKPQNVQAGALSKVWDSLADFTNNNGETSTITNSNVDLNSGNPKLSYTSQSQTENTTAQFGDGTTTGGAAAGTNQVVLVPTVTIGTQVWMKKNLNTTAGICYNNDPANCTTYGRLYSWSSAMNGSTTPGAQGLCPTGFHIPTDAEWKTLEIYLGMTQSQADAMGNRGTDQGTKLKTGGSSGFNGLLGGMYSYHPVTEGYNWLSLNESGSFWTSDSYTTTALTRSLDSGLSTVNRSDGYSKNSYISIRCLKN